MHCDNGKLLKPFEPIDSYNAIYGDEVTCKVKLLQLNTYIVILEPSTGLNQGCKSNQCIPVKSSTTTEARIVQSQQFYCWPP